MNSSEVREVLAIGFQQHIDKYWILPPDWWQDDLDDAIHASQGLADAALQTLKDNGIDIQELQAKADKYDAMRWCASVEEDSTGVYFYMGYEDLPPNTPLFCRARDASHTPKTEDGDE